MTGLLALFVALAVAGAPIPLQVWNGEYVMGYEGVNAAGTNKTIAAAYYSVLTGQARYSFWTAFNDSTTFVNGVGTQAGAIRGQYLSIANIAGNPAISSFDLGNTDLTYVRSGNPQGSQWTNVVYPDRSSNVGMWTSMIELSSGPAIAYIDNSADVNVSGVKFVSASDSLGSNWNSPLFVAPAVVAQYVTLIRAGGNPAVVYYDLGAGRLFFVRASDAAGTTWGIPVQIDPSTTNRGIYAKAAVNGAGIPFVAYAERDTGLIFVAVASDSSASSWSIRAGPSGDPVRSLSLTFAANTQFPILAAGRASSSLQSATVSVATDAGATSWGPSLDFREAPNFFCPYISVVLILNTPNVFAYDQLQGSIFLRRMFENATGWDDSAGFFILDNGNV